MQRIDERRIELQKPLAAGADDKSLAACFVARPFFLNRRGQFFRRSKLSAAGAIRIGKIRIAELADGGSAIDLAARPEIAAGKAAEDGGAPVLRTFALQRVEDFFDGVHEDS